jgi:hypothetical protein
MDLDEVNDLMAESNALARQRHLLAWLMLIGALGLSAFATYAVVFADPCSGTMCPMFVEPPGPSVGSITIGVGFAGLALGLLWMWRIVRADRDPDARSSRIHRSGKLQRPIPPGPRA